MSPLRSLRLASLALAVLPALPAAQGTVHVVDPTSGPGTDFTSLEAAVAAAASGDVLLLRGGPIAEPLLVDGKSLTVAADGATPVVVDSVEVANLSAAHTVVVRGLEASQAGNPACTVRDSAGHVWLEDCDFSGTGFTVTDAASVTDASSVVFARCELELSSLLFTEQSALEVQDSDVYLMDSTVVGPGHPFGSSFPYAPAVDVQGGRLYLSGSTVRGGDGFHGSHPGCHGGDGGTGVLLRSGAPELVMLDSTLLGGDGGQPLPGCGGNAGADGLPLVQLSGTFDFLGGPSTGVSFPPAKREGQQATFTVHGEPGHLAWLLYSESPLQPFTPPLFNGPLLLNAPIDVYLGVLPAGGQFQPTITLGLLPPGIDSATLHLQAMTFGGSPPRLTFGAPSHFLLLDAGI